MKRTWLLGILAISFFLLATLRSYELSSLKPFMSSQRSIKLSNFAQAKKGLSTPELELLELWESMLTGRSAPVSRWMKDQYRALALSHLFTPSGFHLSAVIMPVGWLLKTQTMKLGFFGLLALLLYFIPGMAALKRMLWVKASQNMLGLKIGFVIAMLMDVLFGSFQTAALSFTYSFLFLGIIYSGLKGASLIIWLFLAQLIIAFFQGSFVSPLLLLLSPLLNFSFALAMPLLFVLSIPLWNWQLHTGLYLLKGLQSLIHLSSQVTAIVPCLEIHIGLLMLISLFLFRRFKYSLALLVLTSSSLNLDLQKEPSMGRHEFYPQGELKQIVQKPLEDVAYYRDGKCNRKLIRGLWWERCSPSRRKRSS